MADTDFKVVSGRDGSRSFRGRGRGGYGRGNFRGKARGGGIQKQKYQKPQYLKRGPNPLSRLDDDDDDMGLTESTRPSTSRFGPYNRRGGAAMDRVPRGALSRLGLPVKNTGGGRRGRSRGRGSSGSSFGREYSGDTWYKIIIPYGQKYEKDYILKTLTQESEVPFVPTQYKVENNSTSFYVSDKRAADSLRSISNRITTPKGFKLNIHVKPTNPPAAAMDAETLDKLKMCMSKRYDPATKTLNLAELYHDEDLTKDGIFLALNRHSVASNVAKIVGENIPEVEVINLKSNRLMSLDSMMPLTSSAPNVTRLNLGHNQLKSEFELGKLRKWTLVELVLDGNTMCDRFTDETSYVRAIRKKFPKLLKLDGHDLPPPITFDIESSSSLPPTKGSYFGQPTVAATAQSVVSRFLEQYYALYDGNNRQALMDAYHENAVFSLCVFYNKVVVGKQPPLHDYIQESRNLLRVHDPARRSKAMKTGKLNIVALLTELPEVQHDLPSFVIDVTHAADTLLSFAVQGVFKEKSQKDSRQAIRSFSRTFLAVPQGSGIVIINEELTVTNATPSQMKKAFTTPAPTPSSSPVNPVSAPFPEQQKQMIAKFSEQSGMNLEWSERCLSENNWDYEKSAAVFTDLRAKGTIPAEAFKPT